MFNSLKRLFSSNKTIFKPKKISVKTSCNKVNISGDILVEVQYNPLSRELHIKEVTEC